MMERMVERDRIEVLVLVCMGYGPGDWLCVSGDKGVVCWY